MVLGLLLLFLKENGDRVIVHLYSLSYRKAHM